MGIKILTKIPGPKARKIVSQDRKYSVISTMAYPLVIRSGRGPYLEDVDGNRFLDFASNVASTPLGYRHPAHMAVLKKFAQNDAHKIAGQDFYCEEKAALAKKLVEITPKKLKKVFLINSGAEAVENAIKFAYRKIGPLTGISCHGAFHGRTLGALSATGQTKYHTGFGPLVPGFSFAPINDLDAVENLVTEKTCAIMVEPVQGEGGVHGCRPEFLRGLRRICDEKDVVLIFDEVQCGLGRTGYLFTSENHGVEPDVICLAKSLGSGVPIGAMLCKEKYADVLVAGTHAATFGGNPLACAAAVATMNVIIEDDLPARARRLGELLHRLMLKLAEQFTCIKELRIFGLMAGFELDFPAVEAVKGLRERGVIAGIAGPNVLRFLPPLICEEAEIERAVRDLRQVLIER